MARIGNIYLGGIEPQLVPENAHYSGIAFRLSKASKIAKVYRYDSDTWEVEMQLGHHQIVARSKSALSLNEVLTKGFDYCQKSLDFLAVANRGIYEIIAPGTSYIVFFCQDNRSILREVSCSHIPMGFEVAITVRDKDGTVIPDPPAKKIEWNTSLRYYRLSQASGDLFEAYRNLYLSLEAMLSIPLPKKKGERERDWWKRVMSDAGRRLEASQLPIPDGNDLANYFLGAQYEKVRCKIFHAKNDDILLPLETIRPDMVAEAYEFLLKLWREIARVYSDIPSSGGGVVTNAGFRIMMDGVLGNAPISLELTEDNTPPKHDDTVMSPNGREVIIYDETSYDSCYRPGQVLISGHIQGDGLKRLSRIHRIGLRAGGELVTLAYLPDGIIPAGVDRFESHEVLQLINPRVPKVDF